LALYETDQPAVYQGQDQPCSGDWIVGSAGGSTVERLETFAAYSVRGLHAVAPSSDAAPDHQH